MRKTTTLSRPNLVRGIAATDSTDPILLDTEYQTLKLDVNTWKALYYISMKEEIKIGVLLGHLNFRKAKEVTLAAACRVLALAYLSQVQSDVIDGDDIAALIKRTGK